MIALSFQGCEQAEVEEIRRLVPIDLGSEAGGPEQGEVSIVCRDRMVEIRVPRPSSRDLHRSLNFADTEARARPRLVAIVVVEMLAVGETDSQNRQPAPPAPVEAHPAVGEVLPLAAPPRSSAIQLEAIASGRTLIGGISHLLGGGLRIATKGRVPWSADVLLEQGTPSTSEGNVRVDSLTTGLGLSLVAPIGAATGRAGAGLRGGVAHLLGQPSDSTQVRSGGLWRGWGGPMLDGSVTLSLQRSVVLELGVESGYLLFPVYGLVTGQREVALRGVWIGAQIGVGISL